MAAGEHLPTDPHPDRIRQTINGRLGDANVQRRGLGWGKVAGGQDAGKQDAVYAKLVLADGVNEYTVAHTLERVPGFVRLWGSSNTATPASHYSVIEWDRAKWTRTSLRVRVHAVVGNLAGGELILLVGGE